MAIKIYGTTQCSDTQACIAACSEKALPCEFKDITELPVLKEFLAVRDNSPLFEAVKKAGGVGIPLIQKEDGRYTLDWESILA